FNFGIEVAPPPPQVEVVPAPRPGYVWAPGYWAWEGGRHVWVAGRWIPVHRGYYWVPDRWVEYRGPRGPHWHFEPGHWEREHWHRRYCYTSPGCPPRPPCPDTIHRRAAQQRYALAF